MSRRLIEIQNQINREIPELMASGFPSTYGAGMLLPPSKNVPREGRTLKVFRRTDLVKKGGKAKPLFEHDSSIPSHTNERVEKWIGLYLTGCRPSGAPHYPSEKHRNRCEVCGCSLRIVSRERVKGKPSASDEIKAAGRPKRPRNSAALPKGWVIA